MRVLVISADYLEIIVHRLRQLMRATGWLERWRKGDFDDAVYEDKKDNKDNTDNKDNNDNKDNKDDKDNKDNKGNKEQQRQQG